MCVFLSDVTRRLTLIWARRFFSILYNTSGSFTSFLESMLKCKRNTDNDSLDSKTTTVYNNVTVSCSKPGHFIRYNTPVQCNSSHGGVVLTVVQRLWPLFYIRWTDIYTGQYNESINMLK